MKGIITLIKLKRMYEELQDVYENASISDDEYYDIIENQMSVTKDMYEELYEKLEEETPLTIGYHCKCCGEELCITDVIQYEFVCKGCDENYSIDEVKVKEDVEEHWWTKDSYFEKKVLGKGNV